MVLLLVVVLVGNAIQTSLVPRWKAQVVSLAQEAVAAGADLNAQKEVLAKAENLSPIWPMSLVKKSFSEAQTALQAVEALQAIPVPSLDAPVPKRDVYAALSHIRTIGGALQSLERRAGRIPSFFVPEAYAPALAMAQTALGDARTVFGLLNDIEDIIVTHFRTGGRILLLLQNHNEVRPTGGFVGSFLLFDFTDDAVTVSFHDMYSYDRLVPDAAEIDAPEYFHAIAKEISLRDANIFSDFSESANAYRYFFRAMDEPVPTTVVGINLSVLETLLQWTGPVELPGWGILVDSTNVDLVLSLLVESKAAGRYSVKRPVFDFATALFSPEMLKKVDLEDVLSFDLSGYIAQKNVLANSQNRGVQNIFTRWGIDGTLPSNAGTDDYLHLQFVSIGANKSDRFVWTKAEHETELRRDGGIVNTLTLRRTHALRRRELDDAMGLSVWPKNYQELLDVKARWILGEGENRTMVRVFVPLGAELQSALSPSGDVKTTMSEDGNFTVFEVPMYVKPNESVLAKLQYRVPHHRGSYDWRPYYLQYAGSPGMRRATFLKTLRPDGGGVITEQTDTMGLPTNLTDGVYRSLVEYDTLTP